MRLVSTLLVVEMKKDKAVLGILWSTKYGIHLQGRKLVVGEDFDNVEIGS